MTVALWYNVIKALAMILPTVIFAVREGYIKGEAQDDVLAQLIAANSARVAKMRAAAKDPSKDKKEWQRD